MESTPRRTSQRQQSTASSHFSPSAVQRSGSVPRDQNPFRSTSRDHTPAFDECFAGVAAAERYMAFGDSLHAASPQQAWRSAGGSIASGYPPRDAGPPPVGTPLRSDVFAIRSMSSSSGVNDDDMDQPIPRIERSTTVGAADMATPVSHRGAPTTPGLSPVTDRREPYAPENQQQQQHYRSVAADPPPRPSGSEDAAEERSECVERVAREITAHVTALLRSGAIPFSSTSNVTSISATDATTNLLLDSLWMSDGDFAYYRPKYRLPPGLEPVRLHPLLTRQLLYS